MYLPFDARVRSVLLFAGLVLIACAPVWWVDNFVNQDGSPHLYNANLAIEILRGNGPINEFAVLNPNLIPNLTGHWGLAALLLIFEPVTVTKIAVTFLFALFVSSIAWLRYQVANYEGMGLSLLLAAAISLNWLWLLGFYNFILAASAFAFTLGLWWRWKARLNVFHAVILWLLLVFTFFSHLVSFGLLAFSLGFLAAANWRSIARSSVWWTFGIIALTTPLLANYLLTSRSSGKFAPRWQFLDGGVSISGIAMQLISADPFTIMSRKAFPFVDRISSAFVLTSPSFWIVLTAALIAIAMIARRQRLKARSSVHAWFLLAFIFLVFWIVAPDDFGSAHGGYLRERILLLALVCFVPFVRVESARIRSVLTGCLVFVICFQATAIWEYSLHSDVIAKEFFPAKAAIAENESVGGVYFVDHSIRLRPIPEASITPMLGIGKNGTFWDNYEFGFQYFPVALKNAADRDFVFRFREASTYDLSDPSVNILDKLSRLDAVLAEGHQKMDILLVWNELPGFTFIREKWFENEPYFVSGRLKAYKHR